jgi:hypothetical protein
MGDGTDVPMADADRLREEATKRYKAGDYAGAAESYSAAIAAAPSSQLYANRAAAKMMLKA